MKSGPVAVGMPVTRRPQTRAGATNAHGSYLGCWPQTVERATGVGSRRAAAGRRAAPESALRSTFDTPCNTYFGGSPTDVCETQSPASLPHASSGVQRHIAQTQSNPSTAAHLLFASYRPTCRVRNAGRGWLAPVISPTLAASLPWSRTPSVFQYELTSHSCSTLHGSKSGWFATRFLYNSFIHYFKPVYPEAIQL
jgi:hypothetical protein